MVRPPGPAGEGKTVQDCAAPDGHAQQVGSRDTAMKIMTGNSNRPLAEAISAFLNLELTKASVRRFSDMEIFVEIHANVRGEDVRSEEHTSELQSLMRNSYAVFCLKKKKAHT